MRNRALTRLFLLFRARRDGKALARLFDATAPELLGVAAHLVSDPSQAEDVVQATFLAAIERAEAFDASREVKFWLYGILRREAAKVRRQDGRRVDADRLPERESEDPLERLAGAELPREVTGALARCPRRYREVLEPFLKGGRAPQEIARELGRSPGTVRMQIHRGLERLRRILPATLGAGAAASLLPTRGLGEVRAHVLAAGASEAAIPATVLSVGLGGFAMTNKVLLAATGLAIAALAWYAPWSDPELVSGAAGVAAAPVALLEATGTAALEETDATVGREAIPASGPETVDAAHGPTAAATGFGVAGIVVDASGDPVAGAHVIAGEAQYALSELATTESDGTFVLEFGEWEDAQVYARAAGLAPSLVHRVRALDGPRQELSLVLPGPSARLSVSVSGPSGERISGAAVIAGERSRDTLLPDGRSAETAPRQHASTDADGVATFDALPPGSLPVSVEAEGLVRFATSVQIGSGESRHVEVALQAGWSLEGRLVDGAGAPIEGATVGAMHPDYPYAPSNAWTETDRDGRFLLTGIADWQFTAVATKTGLGRIEEPLTGTAGGPTVWNPVLVPNPGVAGRVIDERGAPLAGWNVLLHRPGESNLWHRQTKTDGDGAFEIPETPTWDFHLSIRTPALWDGGSIVERDDVVAGQLDVLIRVPDDAIPSAVLVGRVRYRSGASAPRAVVRHQKEGDRLMWSTEVDPTTGRFRTRALRPGRYEISISGEGVVFDGPRTVEVERDEELDLGEIVLDDPGFLTVEVSGGGEPPRGTVGTYLSRRFADGHGMGYTFEGVLLQRYALPPGDYEVELRSSRYSSNKAPIVVRSGLESTASVELTSRIRVTLRFHAEAGDPALESVDVIVQDNGQSQVLQQHSARAAADGSLSLELDLDPGGYRITATAPDGRQSTTSFGWGGSSRGADLDFTLKRP